MEMWPSPAIDDGDEMGCRYDEEGCLVGETLNYYFGPMMLALFSLDCWIVGLFVCGCVFI
jgi:hypothetical protein